VSSSETGQALPIIAVVVLLVLLIGVGLMHLAVGLADRARARTAADAAALAGARDGEDMAGRVAEENHARLEQYVARNREVEVTVRVGDERATARAQLRW
jgi:Flp pilus assembly protein TadG